MDQVKTDIEKRNWKKRNQSVHLLHKNSQLLLINILVIIKIMKMILTIKGIIITIIITIIIKGTGRYRTPTTTNLELLVTLRNGQKPLSIIKKSSPSDNVRVLFTPLKRLVQYLMWLIGGDHVAWIPYLELSPTWLLKNTCNGNINQYSNNNNNDNNNYYYDNDNNIMMIIMTMIVMIIIWL